LRARRRRVRGSRFGGAVALCLGLIGCSGAGDGSPPLAKDTDGDSVPDARDCAPADPTRWQLLAYQSRDSDADGYRADATGEVCSGATLPPAYAASTAAAGDADCDDANPAAWRLMMLYVDADGDGVGAGAGQISCVGTAAPPGFSLLGYDPLDDPSDPTAAVISSLELAPWQLTPAMDITITP